MWYVRVKRKLGASNNFFASEASPPTPLTCMFWAKTIKTPDKQSCILCDNSVCVIYNPLNEKSVANLVLKSWPFYRFLYKIYQDLFTFEC